MASNGDFHRPSQRVTARFDCSININVLITFAHKHQHNPKI